MKRYMFFIVATAVAGVVGAWTPHECQSAAPHCFDIGNEQIVSTVLLQTTHQLTSQDQLDEPIADVDTVKSNRSHRLFMFEVSASRPSVFGHPFPGERESYTIEKLQPTVITIMEYDKMMNEPPSRDGKPSREELLGMGAMFALVAASIMLGFLPDPAITLPPRASETAYEATNGVDRGAAAATLLVESPQGDGLPLIGPEMPQIQEALQKGGLVALVNSHVEKTPDRVALIDAQDGFDMRFSEVGAAMANMAEALTSAGLGPGDVLALLLPPSKAIIVASMGAMQAGMTWLPLDPELPSKRVCELLQLARARLAVGLVNFDTGDVPFWCLGTSGEPPISERPNVLPYASKQVASHCPADIACIYFTSGSTGVPKGVMYGTEFLLYNTMVFGRLCCVDESTVGLIKTPAMWVVSAWEIFLIALGGQAVVDSRCQKNIDLLANLISESSVSVLISSAPILRLLVEDAWRENPQLLSVAATSLKHIVNTGSAIPLDCCALVNSVLPQTFIHNSYGCTESPMTEWTYRPDAPSCNSAQNAPAGYPQPESQVHLLNNDMEFVGIGEVGEIFLGGSFCPRGYLSDPSLTESRFIQRGNLRLYRTGDLGRFTPDAKALGGLCLEITGRGDRQLNINGVRVAPEEIETVISQMEGVKEVAVVTADSSIVACCAGKGKGDLVEGVRKHCIDRLSARMRPALIIQLDVLPRLANGKIDLKKVTERANEAASESIVSAMDSLGQMKNVHKGALKELEVLAVIRAVSMMSVVTFHWVWQHYAFRMGQNLISPAFQTAFPLYLRMFIRGFVSNWSMMTFVLMSGYTDRKAAEEKRPGQARENVLVFVLYLASAFPLVPLMDLFNEVNKNGTIVANINGSINGPRWYLLFYLVCRFYSSYVLMPLENRFKGSRSIVLLRILLICGAFLVAATDPPHQLVPGLQPGTALGWIMDWIKPQWAWTKQGNMLLPAYVVSWFFSGAVVKAGREHWPRSIGSWFPAFLFVSAIMYFGWVAEQDKIFFNNGSFLIMAVDFSIAVTFILAFALTAGSPWLRHSQLVRMGQASLGTYAIHYIFWQWDIGQKMFGLFGFRLLGRSIVPDTLVALELARELAGGLGQLIVFFLYPAVFSVTLGVLFQTLFFSAFGAVEKGIRRIC
jgi:acyl-coenzyme A synthetase/AMP-(fatty) acid ligase